MNFLTFLIIIATGLLLLPVSTVIMGTLTLVAIISGRWGWVVVMIALWSGLHHINIITQWCVQHIHWITSASNNINIACTTSAAHCIVL